VRVRWSEEARSSLVGLLRQIQRHDAGAARRQARRIREAVDRVAAHPWSGRSVPEFEVASIREALVPPYRIIYQVTDEIVVLVVLHSRQHL
jgi:toxin ParE1/3/4